MSENEDVSSAVGSSGESPTTPSPADTAAVANFIAPLGAVEGLPVAEHAAIYQQVHASLQSALAEIDGR
jgi:hypothetical protein